MMQVRYVLSDQEDVNRILAAMNHLGTKVINVVPAGENSTMILYDSGGRYPFNDLITSKYYELKHMEDND